MSAKTKKTLTLKDAFDTEFARREMERRARDEAVRKQQEEDLAGALALHGAISGDAEFLSARSLSADIRRYTVSLVGQIRCSTTWFSNEGAVIFEGKAIGCDQP